MKTTQPADQVNPKNKINRSHSYTETVLVSTHMHMLAAWLYKFVEQIA